MRMPGPWKRRRNSSRGPPPNGLSASAAFFSIWMVTTAGLSRAATWTNACESARASQPGLDGGGGALGGGAGVGATGPAAAALPSWWGVNFMRATTAMNIPVTSQPIAASQCVGLRIMDGNLRAWALLLVRTNFGPKVCLDRSNRNPWGGMPHGL